MVLILPEQRRNVATSYPKKFHRRRRPSLQSMALVVLLSFVSTLYSSSLFRDWPRRAAPPPRIRYLIESPPPSLRTNRLLNRSTTGTTTPRSFPKWGATRQEENTIGMSLEPLLDFLFTSSAYVTDISMEGNTHHGGAPVSASNQSSAAGSGPSSSYRPLVNWAWAETLYMVEPGGTLWTSQKHRDVQNVSHKPKVERRFNNTERLMLQALEILQQDISSCSDSPWPTLCRTIDPSAGGHGVPFLAWYGDYDGCNEHNWLSSESGLPVSVPLFTVAARVDCHYTLPFPNYYSYLMPDASDWDALFALYQERYPWENQTAQVIWRGGLTGAMDNTTHPCPRWNLVAAVRRIQASPRRPHALFNVALTNVPPRARRFARAMEAALGPIHKQQDTLDFTDFQKYRAILDIDGNSWSGRFGSLLCFNSVILKVEPTFVDYFYQTPRAEDALRPWTHYIPIRADLQDLEQQAAYALDPAHAAPIRRMIQNANDWCRRRMTETAFATDMLDVWERYVQLLYIQDPEWNAQLWVREKAQIFEPSSPFAMVPLHRADYPFLHHVVDMMPSRTSST